MSSKLKKHKKFSKKCDSESDSSSESSWYTIIYIYY